MKQRFYGEFSNFLLSISNVPCKVMVQIEYIDVYLGTVVVFCKKWVDRLTRILTLVSI